MGFISRNLSKKPYDYVCCLVGLMGGGIFLFGSPLIGDWSIIGFPIFILAIIIDWSLTIRDIFKGEY